MKRLSESLIVSVSVMLLCACSKTYYQVYDVQGENLEKVDNALIYSNSEVAVSYCLWSAGGTVTYMFENKTDKNIFIDMPKSFYIENGVAYDYYSETTNTNSVTAQAFASSGASATVFGSVYRAGSWYPGTVTRSGQVGSAVATTKSSSTKEPMYIIVPPHSAKRIGGYSICNRVTYNCDNMKENRPKRESSVVSFTRVTSPLVFRNRIAYSFKENDANPSYIDNEFYVKSYRNYSQRAAIKDVLVTDCGLNLKSFNHEFIIDGPDRFYNKYIIK